ncbi:MAG: peptide/nickel transport system permease protein, partial [Solirubrobacterales bacterium]|nr:peptide/nickel transport system permease protein [Solirubrobacterales bacterium]
MSANDISRPGSPGGAPGSAGLRIAIPEWVRTIRPGVALAGLVVAFFVVAMIVPSLLTGQDPYAVNLEQTLQSPSWAHIMGTDQSGRDLYARIIYGARESLLIGLGATALGMAVAILLGVLAGLGNKWVDGIISRGVEVMFAFPILLLALLFVAVFGPSVTTEIVAVGLGTAPGYARMVRGQVLSVRDSGYVEAARALGHPYASIVRRHIFPNAMRPLVVVMTLGVGQSIVWASGIAFLGLGVPPPSPEWGALLNAGRNYITQAWWLEVMPGVAIVLFSLSLTTLG